MSYFEPANDPKGSAAPPKPTATSLASLLSLLLGSGSPAEPRRKRSFDAGAVGLGVVAAMSRGGLAAPEADPVAVGAAARRRAREEAELSESYTCVISRAAGGGGVRKRVYFGFGAGSSACCFVEPARAPARDFLSRCCLCDGRLDGLDIYMYRGEKAFCNAECRCHRMLMDECTENCGSEALKDYVYSVSPHSTSLPFSPSAVAA